MSFKIPQIFKVSFTSLSGLFQLIWDGPISRWAKMGEHRHIHKQDIACLTCGHKLFVSYSLLMLLSWGLTCHLPLHE